MLSGFIPSPCLSGRVQGITVLHNFTRLPVETDKDGSLDMGLGIRQSA